ncbi:MAG: hypothetical protein Q9226_004824 [Calogaya cf. arnoldii]
MSSMKNSYAALAPGEEAPHSSSGSTIGSNNAGHERQLIDPEPTRASSQSRSEEHHVGLGCRVQELELQLKLRNAEIASLRATVKDLREQTAKLEDVELQLRLKTLEVEHHSERVKAFTDQQPRRRDGGVKRHQQACQKGLVTLPKVEARPRAGQTSGTGASVATLPNHFGTRGTSTSQGARSNLKRASDSESNLNLPTLAQSPRKRLRTPTQNTHIRGSSGTSNQIVDSSMVGANEDSEASKKATIPVNPARPNIKPARRKTGSEFDQECKEIKERHLARKAAKLEKEGSLSSTNPVRVENTLSQTIANNGQTFIERYPAEPNLHYMLLKQNLDQLRSHRQRSERGEQDPKCTD